MAERGFLMGSILRIFDHVNEKVQQFGTSRRVKLIERKVLTNPPQTGCCRVLPPSHPIRRVWDVLIAVLLLYTALIAPLRLAFEDTRPPEWLAADILMDGVFVGDIIFSFFTGYLTKEGDLVLSRPLVCRKYL